MIRTLLGGLLGGLALFLTGFVFWGTPLSNIAYSGADAAASTNLQAALAQNLTGTGTGVYLIPSTTTSEGTVLYGKGPIAQVLFNTSGYPSLDTNALIGGLILALVVGVIFALALRLVSGDMATRIRTAIAFSLAAVLWLHIGQPIFNHAPWGYFLYLAFSNFVGLALAGVIAAKLMPDTLAVAAPDPLATQHSPVSDDNFGSPLRTDSDPLP